MTVEISERINKIHVLKVTDLKINSHLFTGFTPIIIKMQVHSYVTKKNTPGFVCYHRNFQINLDPSKVYI